MQCFSKLSKKQRHDFLASQVALFGRALILAIIPTLSLVACEKLDKRSEDSSLAVAPLNAVPQTPAPFNNAVNIGRQTALFRRLNKQWLLIRIDEAPSETLSNIILDLSKIEQGIGTLSMGKECRPIAIHFDIEQIHKGQLLVRQIERTLDHCSTPLEDELMAMIAEARSFDTVALRENRFVLHCFQDTLEFTALKSAS